MINILETFLTDYSVSTLVIAIIASVICMVAEFSLKEKLTPSHKTYLPILFSVFLQIGYDAIFVLQAFYIRSDAIIAGAVSGSLSIAISAFCKKVASGKPLPTSISGLLIEELIKDYVHVEKLTETALYIESLIKNQEGEELESNISLIIYENSVEGLSKTEAIRVAKSIIESESNLT